jgi:hypothetical protein
MATDKKTKRVRIYTTLRADLWKRLGVRAAQLGLDRNTIIEEVLVGYLDNWIERRRIDESIKAREKRVPQ